MSIKDRELLVKRLIESSLGREVLKKLGEKASDIIYKRTKAGKDVKTGATFTPLSKPYIKQRSKKILGPYATPRRSNLTNTGEMLESIVSKVTGNTVVVSVEDNVRNDSRLTNKQVAKYVQQNGRVFFELTEGEMRIIAAEYQRLIKDITRRLFK